MDSWRSAPQCVIVHSRPHIVLVQKKEKNALLRDITVPGDLRAEAKEGEKVMRHQYLAHELKRA